MIADFEGRFGAGTVCSKSIMGSKRDVFHDLYYLTTPKRRGGVLVVMVRETSQAVSASRLTLTVSTH